MIVIIITLVTIAWVRTAILFFYSCSLLSSSNLSFSVSLSFFVLFSLPLLFCPTPLPFLIRLSFFSFQFSHFLFYFFFYPRLISSTVAICLILLYFLLLFIFFCPLSYFFFCNLLSYLISNLLGISHFFFIFSLSSGWRHSKQEWRGSVRECVQLGQQYVCLYQELYKKMYSLIERTGEKRKKRLRNIHLFKENWGREEENSKNLYGEGWNWIWKRRWCRSSKEREVSISQYMPLSSSFILFVTLLSAHFMIFNFCTYHLWQLLCIIIFLFFLF